MINFSFPTTDVPGVGPCVTRRVLVERAGINGGQFDRFQQSLVRDQDYFYLPSSSGMACNYYRITIIPQLAQVCPTIEAQRLAQEVTAFMNAQYSTPAALPSSTAQYAQTTVEQPQPGYQGQYAQGYASTPQNFAVQRSPFSHSDPRIIELGGAIAQSIQTQLVPPSPQQTGMTQADLVAAMRTVYADGVGAIEKGFGLASATQQQTADMIRQSRPNVTHTTTNNSDNRAYSALDYVSNPVNAMGRLQFGILCSAIFCAVLTACYGLLSLNTSNQRTEPAPTSIYRSY